MKKINYLDSIINPIITEKATSLSEQNKVIKEIGSSLDIANHYLSLNNNDSDKAIEHYYNDK